MVKSRQKTLGGRKLIKIQKTLGGKALNKKIKKNKWKVFYKLGFVGPLVGFGSLVGFGLSLWLKMHGSSLCWTPFNSWPNFTWTSSKLNN